MNVRNVIRQIRWRKLLVQEVLPFGLSLIVAEQLFHFGSFSLECLAFIGLWHGTKLVIKTTTKEEEEDV